MSQNNIRHLRILFFGDLLQSMYIPDYYRRWILLAEVPESSILRNRFSMSQMIFTGDQDSSVRKIFCQFFIAFHVLCHSVYYLHNSFYLTVIGCIAYCMDTVLAIPGVKVEFFLDHKTSLVAENHRTHKTNVNYSHMLLRPIHYISFYIKF